MIIYFNDAYHYRPKVFAQNNAPGRSAVAGTCSDTLRESFWSDDASDVLLEESLDLKSGAWSGTDFAYDANGNQTRDMSRGVADITYNELNLPARIEFEDGATIEYLYSASGTKLAEIPSRIGLMAGNRRDYVGLIEYEQNKMTRIALTSGYITIADTLFHLFVPDHQGNIMAVIDAKSGKREHYHDYYPYGMPHVEINSSTTTLPPILPGFGTLSANEIIITPPQSGFPQIVIPSKNRRLYSAKELTTDYGLNAYDFEARWLTPAFPRFTTVDPLAIDYGSMSPYAYCGGDPINRIDPTGNEGIILIDHQNRCITIKADYFVVTEAALYRDGNGYPQTVPGYTDKDVAKMSSYSDYLNSLDLTVIDGEFEGYSVNFDLYFENAGSQLDAELKADYDLLYGENIGNTITKGDERNLSHIKFKIQYNDDGSYKAVGGSTQCNKQIYMNIPFDSKENRLHEIFHTFGLTHPEGGGSQGIMHYPPYEPTAIDILEILDINYLPKITIPK